MSSSNRRRRAPITSDGSDGEEEVTTKKPQVKSSEPKAKKASDSKASDSKPAKMEASSSPPPEPAKRGRSKATEAKAEAKAEASSSKAAPKKKETPEEQEAYFLKNWAKIHAKAVSQGYFTRVFKSRNTLQMGGMQAQFTKNPEIIYSPDLMLVGTASEFDVLFKKSEVVAWLGEKEFSEKKIRENFITSGNFEEMKEKEPFKTIVEHKNRSREEFHKTMEKLRKSLKKNTSEKKTRQEKIVDSFDDYLKNGKVYDVSAWDKVSRNGYKTIKAPTGTNSSKKRHSKYPICSNNLEKIGEFLSYLGIEE